MKILVIENRTDVKDDIIIALRVRWPEVEIIDDSNGEKVINTIQDSDVDVVIIGEPISAISNYKLIKNIHELEWVSIIIIGSMVKDDKSLVKAMEYGADEYIQYPFGQMELLSRINAVIRNKQLLFQNIKRGVKNDR